MFFLCTGVFLPQPVVAAMIFSFSEYGMFVFKEYMLGCLIVDVFGN